MEIGSCLPNIFSQVIYSGGYSDGEPPLPIPNREAKPVIADGTARPGGRVGSRRALKESSDERSSGDSFSCLQVCEEMPSGAGGQVYLSWLSRPYDHVCDDRLRFDPLDRSMWPASLLPLRSKFCTCPRHLSMQVSLWAVLMTEPCLSVSLFCRCPIYTSMRVSLWAVPVVDVCLRVSLLCGCPRRCRCGLSLWQDSAVLE